MVNIDKTKIRKKVWPYLKKLAENEIRKNSWVVYAGKSIYDLIWFVEEKQSKSFHWDSKKFNDEEHLAKNYCVYVIFLFRQRLAGLKRDAFLKTKNVITPTGKKTDFDFEQAPYSILNKDEKMLRNDIIPYLKNETAKKIATLLLDGFNKEEIKIKLKLSRRIFERLLKETIKEINESC